MPRLTLAHSEKFLTSVDVAPRTAITYRGALQTLADFLAQGQTELPELGAATPSVVPLNLLQDDTLAKFRHWMRNDKHYHRRTENTYLAGAVRFIEWLDANALLPGGLTSGRMQLVLRDARGRRRVGYKTQPIKEAVPLIIQYYEQHPLPSAKTPRGRRQKLSLLRNRAIVHTLFATGLRAQELASLRRSDCADGAGDKILITGKGEKERVVMLNPEAQQALRDYVTARDADRQQARLPSMQSKQDPLFIRHDRDEIAPITTKTVWQVVNDAARALGLETTVSPHDFRRYIATTLLSEGMPLESVQEFLGHESIVTTRTVYARTWTEVLEDQIKTYRPTVVDAVHRAKRKET